MAHKTRKLVTPQRNDELSNVGTPDGTSAVWWEGARKNERRPPAGTRRSDAPNPKGDWTGGSIAPV